VDTVEIVAAALVVANVALVARRSAWNYPVGIAAVALYASVFVNARLYADAGLQGVFLLLNAYGWREWRRSRAAAGTVVVERLGAGARFGWLLVTAAATIMLGAGLTRWTDAALPWWDAALAAASLVAQFLMARRAWENWVLWIVVDMVSVGVFAARGLWPSAAVYSLLTGIAAWGLCDWLRIRRRQTAARSRGAGEVRA